MVDAHVLHRSGDLVGNIAKPFMFTMRSSLLTLDLRLREFRQDRSSLSVCR